MKALLPTAVLCLSVAAFAAIGPSQQSKLYLGATTQPAEAQASDAPHLYQNSGVITPDSWAPVGQQGCAYIHAFIFERHDGEAPKLVRETYCTPLGGAQVRNAKKPGIYPATLSPTAKAGRLVEALGSMRTAIALFVNDHAKGPASLQELVDGGYLKEIPVDPITGRNDTWQLTYKQDRINDLHSGAAGTSTNGRPYSEW